MRYSEPLAGRLEKCAPFIRAISIWLTVSPQPRHYFSKCGRRFAKWAVFPIPLARTERVVPKPSLALQRISALCHMIIIMIAERGFQALGLVLKK